MRLLYLLAPVLILGAAVFAAWAWSEQEIEHMPEVRDSELEEEKFERP
ncbi:MAG: hypothetical protein ACYCU5_16035 [Actinomycetes bacterium]